MKTTHQLHFLGTGTSTGTPMLGCHCPICTSSNPCDQRLRSSLWIRTKTGGSIVIDTSADLRQQLLFWKVDKVDAAIITHDHADHLHGIDDLRPFCFGPPKKQIPIYVSMSIAETLERRFDYIFMAHKLFNATRPVLGGGIPLLSLMPMPLDCQHLHPQKVADEDFQFFLLPHGHTFTSGFIHDSMAYIPDCQSVDQAIISALTNKKLELLVIDCLQINKHDTHLNAQDAFAISKAIGAKRTRFIHMNHEISHQQLTELALKYFPNGNALPAYDNEVLEY